MVFYPLDGSLEAVGVVVVDLTLDYVSFTFDVGLPFLFPVLSVSSFLCVDSNISLALIKLSLAFTKDSDVAIRKIKRHIMTNVDDLEMEGRLILTLDDLTVRYFIDESGELLLPRFRFESLSGSF